MRNKRVLPALLGSVALTLGLVTVTTSINKEVVNAAEEVTVTTNIADYADENGWSNSTKYTTISMDDNITVTASGGQNTGKYYTSGENWRIYQSENPTVTISVSGEYTLSSVKITYSIDKSGVLTYGGNNITSDEDIDASEMTSISFSVGNTGSATNGQVRITEISVSYVEVVGDSPEEPVVKTPTEEVNELLIKYYNNGSYKRDTVINLKNDEATQTDLIECFHAKCNILERETYFIGEELWMSRGSTNSYSYYGTQDNNVTYATTTKPTYQPEKVSTAIKGNTMEGYYTTMLDIKDNKATDWVKTDNVYSTSDATVIQYFLDFTAPCFLGLDEKHKNYWSMTSVEVEETEAGLELRLVTSGDQGKLTSAKGYLSEATITKLDQKVTITNIPTALKADDGTPVSVKGTVISADSWNTQYENMSVTIEDENGNAIYAYRLATRVSIGDIIVINGTMKAYNNSPQITAGATAEIIYDAPEIDQEEPNIPSEGTSVKYTFSSYEAGIQYADNEEHILDENVTITTTDGHFTSELRLYSSSTYNAFAIIESKKVITKFEFNAGNKVDTLNVYGSTDGITWTLIEGVNITSTSYKDYSVEIDPLNEYKFLKLDVEGTNQVRLKSITLTTN